MTNRHEDKKTALLLDSLRSRYHQRDINNCWCLLQINASVHASNGWNNKKCIMQLPQVVIDQDSDWLISICWPHIHSGWFVQHVHTAFWLSPFLSLSAVSALLYLSSLHQLRQSGAGMHQLWAVLQCQGTVNRDGLNVLPVGRQQRGHTGLDLSGSESGKTADCVCVPFLRGLDEDFLSTGGLGKQLEWVFHKLRIFGVLIFSDVPG